MNRSALRERTARNLRRARATYGDEHPATWAAYGRALAVWGAARIQPLAPKSGDLSLSLIAATAHARICTRAGFSNRSARASRSARLYPFAGDLSVN